MVANDELTGRIDRYLNNIFQIIVSYLRFELFARAIVHFYVFLSKNVNYEMTQTCTLVLKYKTHSRYKLLIISPIKSCLFFGGGGVSLSRQSC